MSSISTKSIQAFVTEVARAGLPSRFAADVSGFDLDPWQVGALDFDGARLLLCCSRQSGKTFSASCLTLHKGIYKPGSLSLIMSPTLRQSMEVFRRITELIRASGVELVEDNKQSCTLENGSRIISLPSKEASIRGYTPDLVVIDEASRCEDGLYYAIRPSLSVSRGSMILLSSPAGQRGFFWEEWNKGSEPWERVEITAEQCPRISKEFLKAERLALGERLFEQEYHCRFLEPPGALFSADLLKNIISKDVKPFFDDSKNISSKIKPFSFAEEG